MVTEPAAASRTWLTTPEAAALAEVSQTTIVAWLRAYPPLGRKVGGRHRIDRRALERWLRGERGARPPRSGATPVRAIDSPVGSPAAP